jgi:hypothetical protein
MNLQSDIVFIDSQGNQYLVRDVLGNGDCALLALLHSPGFKAPVSGATELRRGIVTYARGEAREDCVKVYALVAERNGTTFDMYLSKMLEQGFWVGTVAFIWATMAYGVDIKTHFFNDKGMPEISSTVDFLMKHIQGYEDMEMTEDQAVHVFFHQYNQMKRCKPAMYNHFATMVAVRSMENDNLVTLNKEVQDFNQPWWLKTAAMNMNLKDGKPKKEMNKQERKQHNKNITYEYLKKANTGGQLAEKMAKKLEEAECRDAKIATELKIDVSEMDLEVGHCKKRETNIDTDMSTSRTLTYKYDRRSWKQRATIVFLYLHPQIGNNNVKDTAALTGVNEHTLLGWLSQKKMIEYWIDLVQSMEAKTAIASLDSSVQDLYCHIDPESTVCTKKYEKRINRHDSQIKILFKGGKVSSMFVLTTEEKYVHILMLQFCFLLYSLIYLQQKNIYVKK